MTGDDAETRRLLLDAFRREGIDYPQARLDDAVEDFSHLLGFMQIVRQELAGSAGGSDD
ncbi:MAG: hypothetical protein KDK24_08245 [Pseudooceanicola sp.]|nr:hypothetical protein [Pseudooceanicola sp.]